jgi:hypothetical protein
MDTSCDSLTPLSSDAESSQHFTFSPLGNRKLSMLSDESGAEEGGEEDDDCSIAIKEDARMKHVWREISDFKEKTDVLQKKDYDLRWAYTQRDGAQVFKCILHHNCEFLVRIKCEGITTHHFYLCATNCQNAEDFSNCLTQPDNASYVIDSSGTHTASYTMVKKTGIHTAWIQQVDELLECGVMAGKIVILLHKKATDVTRPLLPTLAQIHNRRKKVFRSTTSLSSQHALATYMKKRMVSVAYVPTKKIF